MLTKQERIIVLFLIGASICGLAVLYHRSTGSPPPEPKLKEQRPEQPRTIYVDVSGAVWKPGVYTLKAGARVGDVLAKALPRKDADLDAVNRAALLRDGQKIVVPVKGKPREGIHRKKVNINTAGKEELSSLPHIGEVRSEAILKYRETHGPFKTKDELKNIPGIGENTLKQLEDQITIH